jgi:hypothetical protein
MTPHRVLLFVVALMLLLASGDIGKAMRVARVSTARAGARREQLQ